MSEVQYYSIEEAAEILGVTTKSVRRWIDNGTIRAYRIGLRLVRIAAADLIAALEPMQPNMPRKATS